MPQEGSKYAKRREMLAQSLGARGIAAARFEDFEHSRNASLRYLCGHPGDAFLIVTAKAETALVAWDINMAEKMASVDLCLPYTSYGRNSAIATRAALQSLGISQGSLVEFPSSTPYPSFVDHVGNLAEWDLICEPSGSQAKVLSMRAKKDAQELAIYERATALTDHLMDLVETAVRSGSLATEIEVALFLEKEAIANGAERMGFETIAAGPARSFGIHAFPAYGSGPFGKEGLSILDFGIVIEGYTTDVTMSFIGKGLTKKQAEMVDLVEKAYELGVSACKPGISAREPAELVDRLFADSGMKMPHSLGHGIGLESHEAPGINIREDNAAFLEAGNIITIEPGLYDPNLGGVRLENDILITEHGPEILSSSRIVRF
jgi:Xaa-Pro dipeptidase